MRMRLLLLLILCVLCPAALAQPDFSGPQPGDRALLFSFNGLSLGSFEGGVGAKWWASNATALTVSTRLRISSREEEASEFSSGSTYDLFSAGLALGAEFHARDAAQLSPFVGIRLGVGYQHTQNVNRYPLSLSREDIKSLAQTGSIDGGLSIGLEYRISERFSLSGRQALSATLFRGTNTSNRPDSEEERRKVAGHSVEFGASTLTLAVYL